MAKTNKKKAIDRIGLDVQTIHLIAEPEFKPLDQYAEFKNTGGMLTFATIMNKGEEPATVTFLSLDGEHDIEIIIAPDRLLQFGPFSINHFNRSNDCVWVDVDKPVLASVQRLGV